MQTARHIAFFVGSLQNCPGVFNAADEAEICSRPENYGNPDPSNAGGTGTQPFRGRHKGERWHISLIAGPHFRLFEQRGNRWPKGQSGNPAGRPVGARQRISEQLLADLASVWEEHGVSVLQRLAVTDAGKLADGLRPVASRRLHQCRAADARQPRSRRVGDPAAGDRFDQAERERLRARASA